MKDYNYNKPIEITEVQILDKVNEKGRKIIKFEYNGEFFRYNYAASGPVGGIHIYKYDNIHTAMNPLATTGKEEIIYNTFNQSQCTDLGRYIEYSIMKWQK